MKWFQSKYDKPNPWIKRLIALALAVIICVTAGLLYMPDRKLAATSRTASSESERDGGVPSEYTETEDEESVTTVLEEVRIASRQSAAEETEDADQAGEQPDLKEERSGEKTADDKQEETVAKNDSQNEQVAIDAAKNNNESSLKTAETQNTGEQYDGVMNGDDSDQPETNASEKDQSAGKAGESGEKGNTEDGEESRQNNVEKKGDTKPALITEDHETAEDWEKTLPEKRTGIWADDLTAVAESQVGYTESRLSYETTEDGTVSRGYTRYGAWNGEPYADWSLDFAAFCMYYAGIDKERVPVDTTDTKSWIRELEKEENEIEARDTDHPDYARGDLIFLRNEKKGMTSVPHMGIVTKVTDDKITVIEGDRDDAVKKVQYEKGSDEITAAFALPENPSESGNDRFGSGEKTRETDTPEKSGEYENRKEQSGSEEKEESGGNGSRGNNWFVLNPEDENQRDAENRDAESNEMRTAEGVAQVRHIRVNGAAYSITVSCDAACGIPADAVFTATSIPASHEQYTYYSEQALSAVADITGQTADASRTENGGQASDKKGGKNPAAANQMEVAYLFDLTICDADGNEIQPAAPLSVTVDLKHVIAADQEEVYAVHFPGTEMPEGEVVETVTEERFAETTAKPPTGSSLYTEKEQAVEPEVIGASVNSGSKVQFTAESFSVYAIVGTTIEKQILAGDGNNYRISVTYGSAAQIPAGAGLEVVELEGEAYETYLSGASVLMEASGFDYARIFDITIVDADGNKIQPASPVEVSVELMDAGTHRNDFSVVHFAEEDAEPEQVRTETEGNVVSFNASSFSAYAIVQGPSSIPNGWERISGMDALRDKAEDGLYIGTTGGFYLTSKTAIGTLDKNTTGIVKTKPAQAFPMENAALYYFEPAGDADNQFYVYCLDDAENRQYVRNTGDQNLTYTDEDGRTIFTVTAEKDGRFRINNGNRYWNMWNAANGNHIAAWTSPTDGNNYFYFWSHTDTEGDPYLLHGKSFGLMSWNGGVAGKAMMADASSANRLDAMALTVMSKAGNGNDRLFVPDDSDISTWTFQWISGDQYYLTTIRNGVKNYLQITGAGLALVQEPNNSCQIKVIPGTGNHEGEICLKSGSATLTYSGETATGFRTGGSAGSEWLRLVEISELTSDYFMTYSAVKVGVSDQDVTNGSRIIVYTRVWNDTKKKYEFYAIDHDGTLVPCYESGDDVQWVGSRLNTLLWNLVEYYEEGTGQPNYYYELYNQYSERFIAPQVTDGQILSDGPIGINLNGRRNGQYYSTILAWDDENYAYAGLKADAASGKIVSCPKAEADDFYFAVMQDLNIDDKLTTVPTVDHEQYGITMKIKNFNDRPTMSSFLGSDNNYKNGNTEPNLLSTGLGEDGYPETKAGNSLSDWFSGADEVNHLFIQSTFSASGYYEYDSTQNFATLDGSNFRVYKELGTMDSSGSGKFYTHGQFMPYNDLKAGTFASTNAKNLTAATGSSLPDSDPRKNEQLYLVQNPDYYMGVELEASFTQTPDGLDDWGHDIIYEFTGDDDFWLYVDGELIIDLGGIHDALPGSVNFRTGEVLVNGKKTTLRKLFEENFRARNPEAQETEVRAHLDKYFDENSTIFRDYTAHTMKIFYLERGAGASNLHMRFNLASVKPGTVLLDKQLSGVDASESVLAEFPYQILYRTADGTEHRLTNAASRGRSEAGDADDYVFYKGTITPVKYVKEFMIYGISYQDVFFLKPGEIAEISLPDEAEDYRIIECAVNTAVYSGTSANGAELQGTAVKNAGGQTVENRKDYPLAYKSSDERAKVTYVNAVNPDALRTLTIKKKLFKEDGVTELDYTDDTTTFSFRLYLAAEFAENLENALANMHTYHVKDPNGVYCTWDAAAQKFVAMEETRTDYASLTDAEKKAASFTTSMNGAISKIPAGYTVEVRNVLAGTQFKVEERPWEIPDGYSFQKYVYNGTDSKDPETNTLTEAETGVADTVTTETDPHVDVCNLRGWGLRVNKIWSDADYMKDRDPVYFAVFTQETAADGTQQLNLVDGTVRRLAYGKNTLYWYFLPLPKPEVPFDNYLIREVRVTGDDPQSDEEGVVTAYGEALPVEGGDVVTLNGTQVGEQVPGTFNYTVLYEKGETTDESNVRVDTVTNNRPGIILRKTDWIGEPLAGAAFTLADSDGSLIGTFTSDEQGQITVAFLSDGKTYTLTETKTPRGYRGLEAPITLLLNNGIVTVGGAAEEYYTLVQGEGRTPSLTIRNRSFDFRAVKVDGDTEEPLAGVTFALHKQYTVDGVTSVETSPMQGYEVLVTDENGRIPKLDTTLAAGTYELREINAQAGYEKLDAYIRFTVGNAGTITLGTCPEGVKLEESIAGDSIAEDSKAGDRKAEDSIAEDRGTVTSVLTIPNTRRRQIRFRKVDTADLTALQGAVFDLYPVADGKREDKALYTGLTSRADGLLELDGKTVYSLPVGTWHLVETRAPQGYIMKEQAVVIEVTTASGGNGVTYDEGTTLSYKGGVTYDSDTKTYTLTISNTSGFELPATGGSGTKTCTLAGMLLILFAAAGFLRKRLRKHKAGFYVL